MKVQTRLFLAMLPTAIALIFVGVFASQAISHLSTHSKTILKDNFLSVLAVQRLIESIERMDSASLFRLTGNASAGISLAEKHRKVFEQNLRIEAANITEPGEREAVESLKREWQRYQEAYDFFIMMPMSESTTIYHDRLYPTFLEVKKLTEIILNQNQDAMVQKSDQVQMTGHRLNQFTFAVVLVTSVVGIMLSLFWGRQILRPLAILSRTVQRLASGDLEARAVIRGSDEVTDLSREFNLMADKLQNLQHSSLGELLLAQQGSQAAIDSLSDPVFIFDMHGAILHLNSAAEAELKTSSLRHALSHDSFRNPAVYDAIKRLQTHILQGNGSYIPRDFDEAVQISTAEGDPFYLPHGNPLKDDKQIAGCTIILQDISRLRRFDQLKSDLVSTVAHEFRNPLTSLRMVIHLLLEQTIGELTHKQEELLFSSRDDCERLETLVEDLLALSRLQEGKFQINLLPASPNSLFRKALTASRLAIAEKELTVIDSSSQDQFLVSADEDKILIVLKQILSVAIKLSPPRGTVQTSVALTDEERVRFEVLYEGEPISPEFQRRIFDKDFSIPSSPGNASIFGLSLAREIVEKHGETIGLSERSGHGIVFWFTLPVAAPRTSGTH